MMGRTQTFGNLLVTTSGQNLPCVSQLTRRVGLYGHGPFWTASFSNEPSVIRAMSREPLVLIGVVGALATAYVIE
jgi:hypothetical protein